MPGTPPNPARRPCRHPGVHTFDTIEELRRGLQDFVAHYNATWLVARHGYRTPNQIRAEQRGLAQCLPAHLPLAA
jgi:putative transposase